MRHSAISIMGLVCLAAAISVSCGGDDDAANGSTEGSQAACASADTASPLATCWVQLAPLGSGGFPPEKGSNDSPKWEPGRWPVTVEPVIAFNDDLWGMSETSAWSSRDGLNWTHYDKTDTGSRIWQAYAFFKDRLWMFGGLAYNERTPVNEIRSSGDGSTWTNAGEADWSPRKQPAVVVFRNKLWLFGGADQVKTDFTTVHTLNDVWNSDDGLHWAQVHRGRAVAGSRRNSRVGIQGRALPDRRRGDS